MARQTINITGVKVGPEPDGSFGADSRDGETFVTSWVVEAEVDGRAIDKLRLSAGSKDRSKLPVIAQYVTEGGTVVSNDKGIKNYKGTLEAYLDSKATREANGDGYKGGGAPAPRSPQPSGMDASAVAWLMAASANQYDGSDALAWAKDVVMLHDVALKLITGAGKAAPAAPAVPLELKLAKAVLQEAGIAPEQAGNDNAIVSLWKECNGNKLTFAMKAARLAAPKQPEESDKAEPSDDNLPF